MAECCCDWPDDCGGIGTLYCDGCGGDICVCPCGGEMSCDGCDECSDEYGDHYFEDEDDE